MVKFSRANVKIQALAKVPSLVKYLKGKRKVYSFDLLSGHSCPFAKECLSKVEVNEDTGKRSLVDGPDTEFRCFSASQEVVYTNVYNSRAGNFNHMRQLSTASMINLLSEAKPKDLGICRIHVAGDFFNPKYFKAWIEFAKMHNDILFYAYTKSLPYWVKELGNIPENLVLTASRGGRRDDLINTHSLRSTVVVFSEQEAISQGLEIDHDDSHAADPDFRDSDFALLIHGVQPKGSEASAAIKELKAKGVNYSYSRATV